MGLIILFFGTLARLSLLNSAIPLRENGLKALLFSAFFAGFWIELLGFFNILGPVYLHAGPAVAGMLIAGKHWLNLFAKFIQSFASGFRNTGLYTLPILFLIGIPIALTGFLVAPNNPDSLSYHLPKLSHWLQNQNVALYPTVDTSQVFTQPLAEYLQLYFFAGLPSDRFVFLPQFIALCFGAVIFSLFAKRWGFQPIWQLALAIFGATLPIALLESVTAQNDLIAAMFLFSAIYFLPSYALPKSKSHYSQTLLWAALAFSLATATKFSVLVFGLPFLILTLFNLIKNIRFWSASWLMVLLFPIICIPHVVRNVNASGRLQGPPVVSALFENTDKSIPGVASILSRNIGFQFGVSVDALNQLNKKWITNFNSFIGRDINAPETTMFNRYSPAYRNNEDMASNPWHLFIIVCVALIIPWVKQQGKAEFYTVIIMSAFSMLLFSYLLKYTPFATRYLIAWIWPLALFAFRQLYFCGKSIAFGVVLVSVFQAIPAVYASELRPLKPRAFVRSLKISFMEMAPAKIPNRVMWEELEAFSLTVNKESLVRKAYPNRETISESLTKDETKELFSIWKNSGLLFTGSILDLPYMLQYQYTDFYFGERFDVLRENAYYNAIDLVISKDVYELGVLNSSLSEHLLRIHPQRSSFKLYILNYFDYMKSFPNYYPEKKLRFVISNDADFSPPDELVLNVFSWPGLWLYELKYPVSIANLEILY